MNLPTIDNTSFLPKLEPLRLKYYPDSILHKKCEPVMYGPHIQALAKALLFTMVKSGGLGLAANQVGIDLRMFVVDVDWPEVGGLEASNSYVFINPAIVSRSAEVVRSVERCLSFPGVEQEVLRAKKLVVHALDTNGQPFTLEAEGKLSVVIQHEFDHIEGHTFVDAKGYLTRQNAKKTVQRLLKRRGL